MNRRQRLTIELQSWQRHWQRLQEGIDKARKAYDLETRFEDRDRLEAYILEREDDQRRAAAEMDRLQAQLTTLEGQAIPVSLFYSYAHADAPLREQLAKHLKPLEREGLIQAWYDGEISPGREWEPAILGQLASASIILLLVSKEFMASDYIQSQELSRAMERHAADEARVVPIILGEVDWQRAPFAKLQALPSGGKAVTTWRDHDAAFTDIAKGIAKVAQKLLTIGN